MKLRGGTQIQIAIGVGAAAFIFVLGFALAGSAFGAQEQGEPAPYTLGGSGTGCYLKDEAFSNKDSIENSDQVVNALEGSYHNISGAQQKNRLDFFIQKSKDAGVNPAILIAFWGAEAGFGNPDQAFGCGNTASGGQGATGESAESSCAIDLIKHAMKGEKTRAADWATPQGENTWTRLLYHYVMGCSDGKCSPEGNASYKINGYVSKEDYPRLSILSKLVPSEVECKTKQANGSQIGDKPDTANWIKNIQNWKVDNEIKQDPTAIVLHYSGEEQDGATKKTVTKDRAIEQMTSKGSYVQLLINSDGKVYQLLPLNQMVKAGSGNASKFAVGIYLIGKSQDDIKNNAAQFDSLIATIRYLEKTYHMENLIGNSLNMKAQKGIFGHMQVEKDAPDPGLDYLKKVWGGLGIEIPKGKII